MPERIGEYTIRRLIGQGAQGLIYEAEQGLPPRRVALKVVRGGRFVTDYEMRLFQREIRSLARLQHPGIASIFAAGRTESDEHYLAMELVEGQPLTQFAVAAQLSLRERVRLFERICEAINYAHQRGVIHRDLKPGNILVRPDGEPKVLDFGLARITDSDATPLTTIADPGRLVGTLPYMSPEQVRASPDEIDIRTDVYSLGVILFELLVGRLPFERSSSSPLAAQRAICEEPPQRPSALNPHLRGDLDTIILKALEKDPARRYQSAAALAEDLRRFRHAEPILARKHGLLYHAGKFARRYRLTVTFSVILLGLILVGGTGLAIAERRARSAVESSTRVTEFMREVLTAYDPNQQVFGLTTLTNTLQIAGREAEREFADQPQAEAAVRESLGLLHQTIYEYPKAESNLRRALALREKLHGPDHPEVATSLRLLGSMLLLAHHFDEAEACYRRALAICRARLGEGHLDTIDCIYGLANVAQRTNRYCEAAELLRQTLVARRARLGDAHVEVAAVLASLSALEGLLGNFDTAEQLGQEALQIRRAEFGDEHATVAAQLNALGSLAYLRGDLPVAARLHSEALTLRRRLFGDGTVEVAYASCLVAGVHWARGEYAEAERLYRDAYGTYVGRLGRDSAMSGGMLNSVGVVVRDQERFVEAAGILREALATRAAAMGPEHHEVAYTQVNLAKTLLELGELEEARTLFSQSLATRRRFLPAGHHEITEALLGLGMTRFAAGERTAGRALIEEALAERVRTLPGEHWLIGEAQSVLGECLVVEGELERGEALLVAGLAALRAHRSNESFVVKQAVRRLERVRNCSATPAIATPE